MQYNLKNFPQWFNKLGDLVNQCATKDEAVKRIKVYLHQETPETILTVIHNTKFFFRCHRQHLNRWQPTFSLNHGCADVITRAAIDTYSELGLRTNNFRNGNTFAEDVGDHVDTNTLVSESYRNELLSTFGKVCLIFGAQLHEQSGIIRRAENLVPDLDLIYLGSSRDECVVDLTPEASTALVRAQLAVEEHLTMFQELRPQRYMANIKMILLNWLLSGQEGEFSGITREDFVIRVTMFIGQLDAFGSVLNERTDMVKALVSREPNSRAYQGLIRANCTLSASITPGIREELTSIFTLGFNALNVKQRFPKLRQSLLSQHLSSV